MTFGKRACAIRNALLGIALSAAGLATIHAGIVVHASGTTSISVQTVDSCKRAIGGAQYQILNSSRTFTEIVKTPAAAGKSLGSGGTCPFQRGNCSTLTTGCVQFTNIPDGDTYAIHQTSLPPADSTASSGYTACLGGSACQQETEAVTVDSSGSVTASTTNVYPDGSTVVWPTSGTYAGSAPDPIVVHDQALGSLSCDAEGDADDQNPGTSTPGAHCHYPEGSESSACTPYPWSCALAVQPCATQCATQLVISAPTTATAGVAFSVTVTAEDPSNNTVTAYAGQHTLSWSGPGNSPSGQKPHFSPNGATTFTNGVGTVSVQLYAAQAATLNVGDGFVTGSVGVTVVPGSTTQFAVANPGAQTAGSIFTEIITATDRYKNVTPAYGGTPTLSFAGPHASPNGTAPLYPSAGGVTFTNAVGKARIVLYDAESPRLCISDGAACTGSPSLACPSGTGAPVCGISTAITVKPNAKDDLFVVSSAPTSVPAGSGFSGLTLTAEDKFGNVLTAYTGSHGIVWGAPTSPNGTPATLPASSVTFVSGVSTTALSATLFNAGSNQLTATSSSPSYSGKASIQVAAGNPAQFGLTLPQTISAGAQFVATIAAEDQYGNTAPAYNGAACLTFSGPDTAPDGADSPQYPGDGGTCAGGQSSIAFTNGTASAAITLFDAETTMLTVGDGAIAGTSAGITVAPSTTVTLTLTVPSTATLGTPVPASLSAVDAYGNASVDTVTVTTSDSTATFPPSVTISAGAGSFSITFNTAGQQTVSVGDGTVTSNVESAQVS